METVKNIKHLNELITSGQRSYGISLAGGACYSRKTISFNKNNNYKVVNHIDETVQNITKNGLYTKSNIGEALDKNSLFTI